MIALREECEAMTIEEIEELIEQYPVPSLLCCVASGIGLALAWHFLL
jgi:hypothetical protein